MTSAMFWSDLLFSLLVLIGGVFAGAVLMWSWLSWPVITRRDRDAHEAAIRRHPSQSGDPL